LYIEDDMRVPFCSSGLNVSKAAQDQKKNEAAAFSTIPRRQGIKRKKGNSQKFIRGQK
jgi:hypothetical protein